MYPYLATKVSLSGFNGKKTTSPLCFLSSSVTLLVPSVTTSFAAAVFFPFTADFFPISTDGSTNGRRIRVRGEAADGREKEGAVVWLAEEEDGGVGQETGESCHYDFPTLKEGRRSLGATL